LLDAKKVRISNLTLPKLRSLNKTILKFERAGKKQGTMVSFTSLNKTGKTFIASIKIFTKTQFE
jgi:hypothetical protein